MPQAPFVRSPYNYDLKKASDDTGTYNDEASLTVQEHALDADINEIARRWDLLGQMPANPRLPMTGDFTHITDYQSALEAVRQADANFMELTPEVRAAFENNPQLLLQAVETPGNEQRLRDLGLLPKGAPAPLLPKAAPAPDAGTPEGSS